MGIRLAELLCWDFRRQRPGSTTAERSPRFRARRGLWDLRIRAANERGLFLADPPQRLVPIQTAT